MVYLDKRLLSFQKLQTFTSFILFAIKTKGFTDCVDVPAALLFDLNARFATTVPKYQ
jgi:hypothetical protein